MRPLVRRREQRREEAVRVAVPHEGFAMREGEVDRRGVRACHGTAISAAPTLRFSASRML